MKKIILITLLIINQLFCSTFEDLKLTDEDFIDISNSKEKESIFDRINQLILLKKSLSSLDDDFIKLNAVNNFFNEYKYKADIEIYKKQDYWATRKEFIINGTGDCEDFVIAKYFTLLELGIDKSKLSILHNLHENEYHLILAYQENSSSEVLVLDSLNKTILPLTKRDDILVLYTLEILDLNNKELLSLDDLRTLSNYKWTILYKKSLN